MKVYTIDKKQIAGASSFHSVIENGDTSRDGLACAAEAQHRRSGVCKDHLTHFCTRRPLQPSAPQPHRTFHPS
eukprot:scaffold4717_cov274-Pinguiococcus_pyrenoidosus.AAC.4